MRKTSDMVLFWGSEYSNWYREEIDMGWGKFSSGEQALMYIKCYMHGQLDYCNKVLSEHNPRKLKAIGQAMPGYSESLWASKRLSVMVSILIEKFESSQRLRTLLLDDYFAKRRFVEASPQDVIFGVGISERDDTILDPTNWKGTNILGTSLDIAAMHHAIRSGQSWYVPQSVKELMLSIDVEPTCKNVYSVLTMSYLLDGNDVDISQKQQQLEGLHNVLLGKWRVHA